MMTTPITETPVRRYAQIAGVLYLIIFICAGFAEGYVRATLIVPGDAAATVGNIQASEGLFRLGFVADLVAFLSDAAVSILLYVLLRPVSKTLALVAASFRLLAHPALASLNLLHYFAVIPLLSGAEYLTAFEGDQLQALVLFFLDLHHYGYLLAGAFFGVHCLLLSVLLYRSELFPRLLGVLMAVAAVGYLAESFGNFLAPQYEPVLAWIVAVPAIVAELGLCVWLLVQGFRAQA